MALALKLSNSQSCDCKTLTFTDATGIYHVTNNPTGWGTPNADYTQVTCAFLKIIPSGSVIPYYIDLTSIFTGATALEDLVFIIDMGDLGGVNTTQFIDGILNIVYTVNVGGTWNGLTGCTGGTGYSVTYNIPLYCVVQQCILAKIAKIPQYYCCDECNNDYVDYMTDLWMMLKALQTASTTTSTTQFLNILEQVQKLCENEDCECV